MIYKRRITTVNTLPQQAQSLALVSIGKAIGPEFVTSIFSANLLVVILISAVHIGAATLIIGSNTLRAPKPIVSVQRLHIIPSAPAPLAMDSASTPEPIYESSPESKTKTESQTSPQPAAMIAPLANIVAPAAPDHTTSITSLVESASPLSEAAHDTTSVSAETRPAREEAGMGSNPAPIYPPVSRKLREQGVCLLLVHILANGQVAEVTLKRSSGYPRLDESAINAVKQWRYQPALENGIAVDSWYQQPVEFTLR